MPPALKRSPTALDSRRARIVCTPGPASENPEILAGLLDAGMDVARLNFSHGTPGEQVRRMRLLRRLARECGKSVERAPAASQTPTFSRKGRRVYIPGGSSYRGGSHRRGPEN